jgi:hypothetical protein
MSEPLLGGDWNDVLIASQQTTARGGLHRAGGDRVRVRGFRAVDPVSLVMPALTSGTAQGLADSASDAVKSAYGKLKQLVKERFAGNRSAEVALEEHATDPETWETPLAKVCHPGLP